MPEQLQHLRGPAALATILAATATTHRHVYPASAADRDGYTDGHCHTCSWHSHPNTYRCAWRHAHTHHHSSTAADGDADIAATTHGDADTTAAADSDADPATAAADSYADPATATTYGYTATADSYVATPTDEHTCSVSHSDSDRWLTRAINQDIRSL